MRLGIILGTHLFCTVSSLPLRAQEEPAQSTTPTQEALGKIREKSLSLLRDIVPASTSGRGLKTVEGVGGIIYWGNLFDPGEVVALVNLAPENPEQDAEQEGASQKETWIYHLSFCAWEKDHWVFRQYLDNARKLEFHDRKDKPNHFVQASRMTGRYAGVYLSWYYDSKTKKLVPTGFENWGPFYLVGNYLCTLRGMERRAMDETVWVYHYKYGKKGNLQAEIDYPNIGKDGVLRDFIITFRDDKAEKYWTYSFSPKEEEEPFLHYYVEAVEGPPDEPYEKTKNRVHYSAEMEVGKDDNSTDEFCFEQLTGVSRAVLNHQESKGSIWKDTMPKLPPIKQNQLNITGDQEIIRHFNKK